MGQTPGPINFAVSPLNAELVKKWLLLEKNLLTLAKKPGAKLPNGKPMDATQTTALHGEITLLLKKIGPLAPALTTKMLHATSVADRKTMLTDLKKRTEAAKKHIVEFKKVGGSHQLFGTMLFKAIDNLNNEVSDVHLTYLGYVSGKIPIPVAKK